jgi:long-chain acyl-CoA synthetase
MSDNLSSLILSNQGIAILDADSGKSFSYKDLNLKVNNYEEILLGKRGIYGVKCENRFPNIAFYIACLKTNTPLLLLPANISEEAISKLVKDFKLCGVFSSRREEVLSFFDSEQSNLNSLSNTSILLGTSGSQSSPRFVKISMQNLVTNSFDIVRALQDWRNQRCISTLPWHYSYGLSIINTHLLTGNTVVLNQHPIISEKFWENIHKYQVTNFGGVPSQYETLYRLRDRFIAAESLKYVTQAGGKLGLALRTEFHNLTSNLERDFYIMYGQTEATARISILSPEQFEFHEESVGKCVGNGTMTEIQGELVFKGGNVCLGYASELDHLFYEDGNLGILHTGDRGFVDSEGFIYITGRIGRDVKISGTRISLDIVESQLEKEGIKGYALELEGKVAVVYSDVSDFEKIGNVLWSDFNISKRNLVLRHMQHIPLLDNGKIDYRFLREYF